MVTPETEVKNAERMMVRAAVVDGGIRVTFADGCSGMVPFADIPEAQGLTGMELPNPYRLDIVGAGGQRSELPWDFVRHYCDVYYREREEAHAEAGRRSLGNRLRALREAARLTQSDLAVAAGIGRITEVRIENGEQSPRYDTLARIARALGRPLADLVAGEVAFMVTDRPARNVYDAGPGRPRQGRKKATP
jgi:DNA-binding XRE family transcriptional regulator